MKNEILDAPLDKNIFDFLEKGEKIIWTQKPKEVKFFPEEARIIVTIILMFVIPVLVITQPLEFLFTTFGILAVVTIPLLWYSKLTKKKTYYALTQKRLIWVFEHSTRVNSHFIFLKDIKWVDMEDHAIFIKTKSTDLVNFKTHSFKTGERRSKPTLENVKNIEKVAQLIEQQIEKNDEL